VTLLWKEPFSALRTARAQASLSDELERAEREQATTRERAERVGGARRATGAALLAAAARDARAEASPREAIGRLEVDALDLDAVVVEGSGDAELRDGPGRYGQTAMPGERGTVGIAGHRTTYGAPFRNLDRLSAGDRISLRMPYGRFVYAVSGTRIVDAGRKDMLAAGGRDRLVLTACHPLFGDDERIVVSADLVEARPR